MGSGGTEIPFNGGRPQSNARCGSCGKQYGDHHFENHGRGEEAFCNLETTGDVFTDQPSDDMLISHIRQYSPAVIRQATFEWRRKNKHL